MGVIRAYADTSGTEDASAGAIVSLSLLATEAEWTAFEVAWEGALSEHGLRYFRMTEFVGSWDQFYGWRSKPETERLAFFRRLVRILVDTDVFCVFGALGLPDYRQANGKYAITERIESDRDVGQAGAFALTAGICHKECVNWIEQRTYGFEALYFFEDGDVGIDTFKRMLKNANGLIPSVTFLQKKRNGLRMREFEAADMVAWTQRRAYSGKANTDPFYDKCIAIVIEERLKLRGRIYDLAELEKFCEHVGIDRR